MAFVDFPDMYDLDWGMAWMGGGVGSHTAGPGFDSYVEEFMGGEFSPSSGAIGGTWSPSYNPGDWDVWLESFAEGGQPILPYFDYLSEYIDMMPGEEGIQSTAWGGQMENWEGFANIPYQSLTSSQLAQEIGWLGFGNWGEAGQYADEFSDFYQFATWGDPTQAGSYAGQLAALGSTYAQEESGICDAFHLWQEGEYDLLEDTVSNQLEEWQEGQTDIADTLHEEMQGVVSERRVQERLKSGELTEARRAGGRTGFGETKRFKNIMKEAEVSLREQTTSAHQITETSEQNWEQLNTDAYMAAELEWGQYNLNLKSRLEDLDTQLDSMRNSFVNSSEGIYFDWVDNLVSVTQDIVETQQDIFEDEEWEDSFNPWGDLFGQEGIDACAGVTCWEGAECNPETGVCE